MYRADFTTCPDDGSRLVVEATPGATSRIGQVLGNYRLVRVIGEGGLGTVYEGSHVKLGRTMALKVLHPDAASDEVVRRFFDEARAVNKIRHPNIIDIEDFVTTAAGEHFLVMELLDGEDLRAVLARERRLAPDRITAIGEQIASALAAVHEVGIVHRDLKPDNVFAVRRDGRELFKLVDFGIAKFLTEGQGVTRAGITLGTPEYMAPEQIISGGQIGPRVDIYALGMLMYECLTGAPAFTAPTTAGVLRGHINEPVVSPSLRRGEPVPPVLEAATLKCLAKDPEHRFQTAGALRVALGAGEPIPLVVPPGAARPRKRIAQMIPAFAMVAAALVLHFAPRSDAKALSTPPPAPPQHVSVVQATRPAPPPESPPPPSSAPPAPAPPEPEPAPSPKPVQIALELASEPKGAELFLGPARASLGRAPVTTHVAMSSEPIRIVARFADGHEVTQSIVPDRELPAVRFVEPRAAKPRATATKPTEAAPTPARCNTASKDGIIDAFGCK